MAGMEQVTGHYSPHLGVSGAVSWPGAGDQVQGAGYHLVSHLDTTTSQHYPTRFVQLSTMFQKWQLPSEKLPILIHTVHR